MSRAAKIGVFFGGRRAWVKAIRAALAGCLAGGRYPNGPTDSEAVAVDPALERVLILTKRTFPMNFTAVLRVRENTPVVTKITTCIRCRAIA